MALDLIGIHRQGPLASEYIPNFEPNRDTDRDTSDTGISVPRPERIVSENGQEEHSYHATSIMGSASSSTAHIYETSEDDSKTGKNFHQDRKELYLWKWTNKKNKKNIRTGL